MLANSVWIIDSNFRWEIKAMLYNITPKPVTVKQYERIVQLEPSCKLDSIAHNDEMYHNWDELNWESSRWTWWFGSTWQF